MNCSLAPQTNERGGSDAASETEECLRLELRTEDVFGTDLYQPGWKPSTTPDNITHASSLQSYLVAFQPSGPGNASEPPQTLVKFG